MSVRAFIGLGSNLGDRLGNLRSAVEALGADPQIEVVTVSSVYDTEPIGPSQPSFLNAVAEIRSARDARDLVRRLKAIEDELGRLPRDRWGPREIDLDLLVYGDETIAEESVQVPHPQMAARAFVLVPLAEIAPDAQVPGIGRVSELAERTDRSGVRRFGSLTSGA